MGVGINSIGLASDQGKTSALVSKFKTRHMDKLHRPGLCTGPALNKTSIHVIRIHSPPHPYFYYSDYRI